ncbi:unnamed protein product [Candida verbasci]|uniref:Ketopantoate reductase C-terminal domain-containing protein n=1 Tax=Candida verbasci TaxID=1227364 RepID=A0A9W4TWS1_9ASCO|nr:unnamed protein product [Candida verbasci]
MYTSLNPKYNLLTNYLLVGQNQNVAFYAWRINQTKLTDLSIINSLLNPNKSIIWESQQLGSSQYNAKIYSNIKSVPQQEKFDIIILSCNSLQDFQSTTANLHNVIHENSLIIIESTGYINLEPFVSSTLSKKTNPSLSNVCVLSIMNESDVRIIGENKFSHQIRNNDTRIYLGSCTSNNQISSNKYYQLFMKMLNTIQENSYSSISLLKSINNPKEFMTYQWKLALPRIVFNPLLILFEIEFPENLQSQILTKPLITGLIGEIFKLIKKMDCKLVKGFENEANLLKSWSNLYPATTKNPDFKNSPISFYNYFKQLDLELDLLLLQPILLGDDYGIRTPYLESLYSILCQFNKINNENSLFFKRKTTLNDNIDSQEFNSKQQEYDQLITSLRNLEISKISIDNDISKQELKLTNLNQKIVDSESRLEQLQLNHDEKVKEYQSKIRELELMYQQKLKTSTNSSSPRSIPNQQPTPVQEDSHNLSKNYRDSVMTQDGLSDLKHIVQYGATLNGEQQQQQTPKLNGQANENFIDSSDLPPHLLQKELELQRREQALLNREQQGKYQQPYYEQQPPPHQQYYNNAPPQQNFPPRQPQHQPQSSYFPNYNYNDQVPPQGLPNGGMPQNQLSQNLKSQKYPPQMQPQQQQFNQPPPQQRRLSSMASTNSCYDYQQQSQQLQQYNPGGYSARPNIQQNHSSFNNAAPIDPFVEGRFKQKSRNHNQPNRKSQMPLMNGNIDGMDFGGRGGMPLPGNRKSMNVSQQLSSPPQLQRKSNSTVMLNQQQQPPQQQAQPQSSGSNTYGNYLQPPLMNESQSSSQSSSATNETPKTSNGELMDHEIRVPQQPIYDANAIPLGGISNSNKGGQTEKKKKKGFFGKNK